MLTCVKALPLAPCLHTLQHPNRLHTVAVTYWKDALATSLRRVSRGEDRRQKETRWSRVWQGACAGDPLVSGQSPKVGRLDEPVYTQEHQGTRFVSWYLSAVISCYQLISAMVSCCQKAISPLVSLLIKQGPHLDPKCINVIHSIAVQNGANEPKMQLVQAAQSSAGSCTLGSQCHADA